MKLLLLLTLISDIEINMIKYAFVPAGLILALSGCTTNVETNPPRTATEEMLLSSASDRAAASLMPGIPPDARVFVDNSNFEGTDSKYAVASIRSHLLQRGLHLADDKKNADVVIETRAGALSTDRKTFLIGIPGFNIPIPLTSGSLPFPEIAIYGKDEQNGVAKFAITGFNAKDGTLIAAQDPQYGFSHNTKKTILIFFSSTQKDFLPEGVDEDTFSDGKTHLGINGNGYSPSDSNSSSSPDVSATPAASGTATSSVPSNSSSTSSPFKLPGILR